MPQRTRKELEKLKVPELKEICEQLGVETDGTKAQLLNRILDVQMKNLDQGGDDNAYLQDVSGLFDEGFRGFQNEGLPTGEQGEQTAAEEHLTEKLTTTPVPNSVDTGLTVLPVLLKFMEQQAQQQQQLQAQQQQVQAQQQRFMETVLERIQIGAGVEVHQSLGNAPGARGSTESLESVGTDRNAILHRLEYYFQRSDRKLNGLIAATQDRKPSAVLNELLKGLRKLEEDISEFVMKKAEFLTHEEQSKAEQRLERLSTQCLDIHAEIAEYEEKGKGYLPS